MFAGQKVIVNGAEFGRKNFEAVVLENPRDGTVLVADMGRNYYCVNVDAVSIVQEATIYEWVLKNADELYVQDIGNGGIIWTNHLNTARRYSGRSYALSSLTRYQGRGIHQRDVSHINIMKVRVIMTEVSE